jgi:hypothetical protein
MGDIEGRCSEHRYGPVIPMELFTGSTGCKLHKSAKLTPKTNGNHRYASRRVRFGSGIAACGRSVAHLARTVLGRGAEFR